MQETQKTIEEQIYNSVIKLYSPPFAFADENMDVVIKELTSLVKQAQVDAVLEFSRWADDEISNQLPSYARYSVNTKLAEEYKTKLLEDL